MSAVNIAEEMNVAVPERAEAAAIHPTRPFLWSIRRELWENPSIVIAPVAVASVMVLSVLIAAVRLSGRILISTNGQPMSLSAFAAITLGFIAVILGFTMVLVALFYSLDALHSERRDRSIFFWKSLPVSDGLTVLSKFAVPMAFLPAFTFLIALAAQIVVFLIENVAMLAHHVSPAQLWIGIPWLSVMVVMAYSLVTVTLWYAPIYAWLLLVSARAHRAALVWAVVPFFLLAIFERIAFHTRYVGDFVRYRFGGVFLTGFAHNPNLGQNQASIPLSDLTPGRFLATPGLWTGLIFAALALILIIRLRRSSEPI